MQKRIGFAWLAMILSHLSSVTTSQRHASH